MAKYTKVVTLPQAPLGGVQNPPPLPAWPCSRNTGFLCLSPSHRWPGPACLGSKDLYPYRKTSTRVQRSTQTQRTVGIALPVQDGGSRRKASLPEETVTWTPGPQTSRTLHSERVPAAAQTKTSSPLNGTDYALQAQSSLPTPQTLTLKGAGKGQEPGRQRTASQPWSSVPSTKPQSKTCWPDLPFHKSFPAHLQSPLTQQVPAVLGEGLVPG